jgi:hypothetical protein
VCKEEFEVDQEDEVPEVALISFNTHFLIFSLSFIIISKLIIQKNQFVTPT